MPDDHDNVTPITGRRPKKELATVREWEEHSTIDEKGVRRLKPSEEVQDWKKDYAIAFSAQNQAVSDPGYEEVRELARQRLYEKAEFIMWRMLFEPALRPIYQRSELVGYEPIDNSKHAQWMAKHHMPETYDLPSRHEHLGGAGATVSFAFNMGDAPLELEAEDAEVQELTEGE